MRVTVIRATVDIHINTKITEYRPIMFLRPFHVFLLRGALQIEAYIHVARIMYRSKTALLSPKLGCVASGFDFGRRSSRSIR